MAHQQRRAAADQDQTRQAHTARSVRLGVELPVAAAIGQPDPRTANAAALRDRDVAGVAEDWLVTFYMKTTLHGFESTLSDKQRVWSAAKNPAITDGAE